MKTAHLLIATSILAFFFVSTPTVQAEDYLYETNNGTITITGNTGPGGDVSIPSTINSLPVTTIGGWAFSGCSSLTSVTIPNSVTSIEDGSLEMRHCPGPCWFGSGAFTGTGLTNVVIPDSVTNLGFAAFFECSGLTEVLLPNSTVRIGNGAFLYCCTSLTGVTIPNSVTRI